MKKGKFFSCLIFLLVWIYFPIYGQVLVKDSMIFDGLTRYYSVYVPASYTPSQAAPLIFNLHGYGSNGTQQMLIGDFRPIADTAGCLIVIPEGTYSGLVQYWNVGLIASTVNDIGFITALSDTLSAHYHIDPDAVYSTGLSNGAFMSYLLACQTTTFAAIAPVAGSFTQNNLAACVPVMRVPVLAIHGTSDNIVPYNGLMPNSEPVDTAVNFWIRHNHCISLPVVTNLPDLINTDGATATHYVYNGGWGGSSVEFYKILNGGHTWPGSSVILGTTCQDFNACAEIWRFFRQHKRVLSGNREIQLEENSIPEIYPNPVSQTLYLNTFSGDVEEVEVMDLGGKILLTAKHIRTLDVSMLSPQMYLLRMKVNSGWAYRKFVIL